MSELHQHPALPVGEPSAAADDARPGNWQSFVAAVQFLTRVRLGGSSYVASAALRQAPIFFPLVGTLIGLSTAGAVALGGLFWPAWLAVSLALAFEARLTGALHEDALADFCDAFGGGWTREQTLEILKDSRIGSYGATALILGILLRAGAIIWLASQYAFWTWGAAIVAAATASRWIAVLAMVCVAPVSHRESLARDVGARLGMRDLLVASLWGLPGVLPFGIMSPLHAAASCLVVAPLVWWLLRGIERRLGGITGDCLGFLTFVSQVAILLVAAARLDFWKALP